MVWLKGAGHIDTFAPGFFLSEAPDPAGDQNIVPRLHPLHNDDNAACLIAFGYVDNHARWTIPPRACGKHHGRSGRSRSRFDSRCAAVIPPPKRFPDLYEKRQASCCPAAQIGTESPLVSRAGPDRSRTEGIEVLPNHRSSFMSACLLRAHSVFRSSRRDSISIGSNARAGGSVQQAF